MSSVYKNVVISLIFSFIYALVPWDSIFYDIYGYGMIDRYNNVMQFGYRQSALDYIDDRSLSSIWSNELGWHYVMYYLTDVLNLSPDFIFDVMGMLLVFAFSMVVLAVLNPFYLLFLVNPLVVEFAFSQSRNAFAITILILAALFHRAGVYWIVAAMFVALALTVHASAVFFVVIYFAAIWLANFSEKRDARTAVLLLLFFFGMILAFAVGPGREVILGAIGDRRAYDYRDMTSSLSYLSFWMLLLAAVNYRVYGESQVRFNDVYSLIILAMVFGSAFFGGYPGRFLAAAFPLLLVSIGSFRGYVGVGVVLMFLGYEVLQWAYWLKLI